MVWHRYTCSNDFVAAAVVAGNISGTCALSVCVVCYCVFVTVYFVLVKGQMVKVVILVTGTCKEPLVVDHRWLASHGSSKAECADPL